MKATLTLSEDAERMLDKAQEELEKRSTQGNSRLLDNSTRQVVHKIFGDAKKQGSHFLKSLLKAFERISREVETMITTALPGTNGEDLKLQLGKVKAKLKLISSTLLAAFDTLLNGIDKGLEQISEGNSAQLTPFIGFLLIAAAANGLL